MSALAVCLAVGHSLGKPAPAGAQDTLVIDSRSASRSGPAGYSAPSASVQIDLSVLDAPSSALASPAARPTRQPHGAPIRLRPPRNKQIAAAPASGDTAGDVLVIDSTTAGFTLPAEQLAEAAPLPRMRPARKAEPPVLLAEAPPAVESSARSAASQALPDRPLLPSVPFQPLGAVVSSRPVSRPDRLDDPPFDFSASAPPVEIVWDEPPARKPEGDVQLAGDPLPSLPDAVTPVIAPVVQDMDESVLPRLADSDIVWDTLPVDQPEAPQQTLIAALRDWPEEDDSSEESVSAGLPLISPQDIVWNEPPAPPAPTRPGPENEPLDLLPTASREHAPDETVPGTAFPAGSLPEEPDSPVGPDAALLAWREDEPVPPAAVTPVSAVSDMMPPDEFEPAPPPINLASLPQDMPGAAAEPVPAMVWGGLDRPVAPPEMLAVEAPREPIDAAPPELQDLALEAPEAAPVQPLEGEATRLGEVAPPSLPENVQIAVPAETGGSPDGPADMTTRTVHAAASSEPAGEPGQDTAASDQAVLPSSDSTRPEPVVTQVEPPAMPTPALADPGNFSDRFGDQPPPPLPEDVAISVPEEAAGTETEAVEIEAVRRILSAQEPAPVADTQEQTKAASLAASRPPPAPPAARSVNVEPIFASGITPPSAVFSTRPSPPALPTGSMARLQPAVAISELREAETMVDLPPPQPGGASPQRVAALMLPDRDGGAPAVGRGLGSARPMARNDGARPTLPGGPPVDLDETDLSLPFQNDGIDLPSNATGNLEGIARRLSGNEALRVTVMAYAGGGDANASEARHTSLSRALAVRAFLIDQGVRSTRIDVRALGDRTGRTPLDRVDLRIDAG